MDSVFVFLEISEFQNQCADPTFCRSLPIPPVVLLQGFVCVCVFRCGQEM